MRYYDPRIGMWLSVDPLAEKFPAWSPYHYAYDNPVRFIDPTGMAPEDHIDITRNKDGTYTVVGGHANKDKNIYVVDSNGKRTGEVLGQMLTEYSFHNEQGKAIVGAKIDLNDKSGQNFFNNEIKNIGLLEYINNAKGGEPLDFKRRNIKNKPDDMTRDQYVYRGMPFGGKIASARDIGNYAAGYVAGAHGLEWWQARVGFDALESYQKGGISIEGQPTQRAERAGFNTGRRLYLNTLPSVRNDVQRIDMIYNNPKF